MALHDIIGQAVGPDVRLHVDANHGYSSLVAVRTVPQWEPYDVADRIVAQPIEIRDGRILLTDAHGIGIRVDEEQLERYRTDRD
jgi:L-alanine-DL-glutamate epimerase-like enolase superfamily enzyme